MLTSEMVTTHYFLPSFALSRNDYRHSTISQLEDFAFNFLRGGLEGGQQDILDVVWFEI